MPQLLHPKMIGEREGDQGLPHPVEPGMWWHFGQHHQLETVAGGLYRFGKGKGPKLDTYMPPFAILSVLVTALHVTGVVPQLSELNLFHEGMVIGMLHLDFPALPPEFIRWSYEHYVAAPLKIGNNVEVDMSLGFL